MFRTDILRMFLREHENTCMTGTGGVCGLVSVSAIQRGVLARDQPIKKRMNEKES